MRTFSLLGGLLLQAIAVFGQQSYEDIPSPETPSLFHYHGCAEVELGSFTDAIAFSDGNLTHEACQAACQGHSIAALFPDSCRCSDDYDAFSPLDSSACDYPCMGDPAYGMCGSQCPTKGPGISTIYIISDQKTVEFEEDPEIPEFSPSVLIATFEPSRSEEPTLIPEIVSEPPHSESTDPPDATTSSTTSTTTSFTSSEITLFPTANTTVSRTTSSASSSTSEDPTGTNVERDDPPTPSQLLQSGVDDLHGQPLSFLSALALVIAAVI